eukprot:840113-Amphidinium_carterae.1
MRDLQLEHNKFTGTLSSANHLNLLSMWLMYNLLTGSLPESPRTWTSLRVVYLGSNRFSGTLPEGMCSMLSIRIIALEENYFHGSFLSSCVRFPELEELDLADNSLSGTIPDAVGSLTLRLTGNCITGSIPETRMASATGLQFLGLDRTNLE